MNAVLDNLLKYLENEVYVKTTISRIKNTERLNNYDTFKKPMAFLRICTAR